MNDHERDEHARPADAPDDNAPARHRKAADRSLSIIVLVIVVLLAGIGIYAWATLDADQTALDGGSEQTTTQTN